MTLKPRTRGALPRGRAGSPRAPPRESRGAPTPPPQRPPRSPPKPKRLRRAAVQRNGEEAEAEKPQQQQQQMEVQPAAAAAAAGRGVTRRRGPCNRPGGAGSDEEEGWGAK